MRFVIITQPGCKPCAEAKDMLRERGESFVEFSTADTPALKDFVKALIPNPTVPQIFVEGTRIGGRDQLREFFLHRDRMERM